MELDEISRISYLDFDIAKRKLTVFHESDYQPIDIAIQQLNLGGKRISTAPTNQTVFKENTNQKRTLWSVLAINFVFFLLK